MSLLIGQMAAYCMGIRVHKTFYLAQKLFIDKAVIVLTIDNTHLAAMIMTCCLLDRQLSYR